MPELDKSKLQQFSRAQLLRNAGITEELWTAFSSHRTAGLHLGEVAVNQNAVLTIVDGKVGWLPQDQAAIELQGGRAGGNPKTNPFLQAKEDDGEEMKPNEVMVRGVLVPDEYAEVYEWFFGAENITTPSGLREQLQECDGDMTLRIDSPGGYVKAASVMCALLAEYECNITAVIEGLAASAATLVMLEASTVKIAQYAEMMIHRSSAVVDGSGPDIVKAGKYMLERDKTFAAAYAKKAGKPDDEMLKLMAAETWFTAQAAIDIGLADEMLARKPKMESDDEKEDEMKASQEAFDAAEEANLDLLDLFDDDLS